MVRRSLFTAGSDHRCASERACVARHNGLDPDTALARLDDLLIDECLLVMCHDDYTPPDVLLDADGIVGYVDLGEIGVADR